MRMKEDDCFSAKDLLEAIVRDAGLRNGKTQPGNKLTFDRPRKSFEIEEDFDPVKLGLGVPEILEIHGNQVGDARFTQGSESTTRSQEKKVVYHCSVSDSAIEKAVSADCDPTTAHLVGSIDVPCGVQYGDRSNTLKTQRIQDPKAAQNETNPHSIDFAKQDLFKERSGVPKDLPNKATHTVSETSIPMTPSRSAISYQNSSSANPVDDVFVLHSKSCPRELDSRPRPKTFLVRRGKARLPGTNRFRPSIRVFPQSQPDPHQICHSPFSKNEKTHPRKGMKIESQHSPFQQDVSQIFSPEVLLQIQDLAKSDTSQGIQLPSILRDFFPALHDPKNTISIANHLRRKLGLDELNISCDKVALRKAIAQMKITLYTELVAALLLPNAPPPKANEETTDEEMDGRKKNANSDKRKIELAPRAVESLSKLLPKSFPAERNAIKDYFKDGIETALGEQGGKVIWEFGTGRLIGGKDREKDGTDLGIGFRGKVIENLGDGDGLVQVFVDHSNILHGLLAYFHTIPHSTSTTLPPRHLRTLSLPVLSLLLRRGRATPPGTLHVVASSPLSQDLDQLVRLGWEVSVLKRVEIYSDEVVDGDALNLIPKAQNTSDLAHTNVYGTGLTNASGGGLRRFKEQGVDEILHLKLLQALNSKSTPAPKGSTIVLATGDARGGQFNRDGFVGGIREALKRGWNVELWSFSSGLSRSWTEVAKRERWGSKFQIRLLDEWAEWLIEVMAE